jgi:hypothetical protein
MKLNSFLSGGLTTIQISISKEMAFRQALLTGLSGGVFGLFMERIFENFNK